MPLADEQERVGIRLELPRSIVETVILAARRQTFDQRQDRERLARIILKSRQRRAAGFPGVAFGEPGWDMILQLYIADCVGQPIDVTGLCGSAGVPKTTALRHLDQLERLQLVERRDDDTDGRRIFVELTPSLRAQAERWLDSTCIALDIGPP